MTIFSNWSKRVSYSSKISYSELQWSDLLCTGISPGPTHPRLVWNAAYSPVTKPHSSGKAVSFHRTKQKLLLVLFLGLLPAANLNPYSLAAALIPRSHVDLRQVTRIMETHFRKLLEALSPLTFAGLCYFNYQNVGICRPCCHAVKLWPFWLKTLRTDYMPLYVLHHTGQLTTRKK